jgi:ABC-2 type transport system permease protein
LLRALPLLLVAGIFLGLTPPASLPSTLAFIISLGVGLLLSSAITVFVSITLMWTVSGEGTTRLICLLAYFLSGLVIPIPFFPSWAQTVMKFLPFKSLADTPFRLYTGHIPFTEASWYIAQQLIWVLIMVLLGRWILSRGIRRLVVQGG